MLATYCRPWYGMYRACSAMATCVSHRTDGGATFRCIRATTGHRLALRLLITNFVAGWSASVINSVGCAAPFDSVHDHHFPLPHRLLKQQAYDGRTDNVSQGEISQPCALPVQSPPRSTPPQLWLRQTLADEVWLRDNVAQRTARTVASALVLTWLRAQLALPR
jgi:hypothetical protein